MKLSLILVIFCFIVSCKTNPADTSNQKKDDNEQVETASGLTISKKSIVILSPDSVTFQKSIDSLRKQYGDEGLAEIGSDEGFYIGALIDFAKSKNIEIINTEANSLNFIKSDCTKVEVKNSIPSYAKKVYMFDGKKNPMMVKSIATFSNGEEFNAYFDN